MEFIPKKSYYQISEVCEITDVDAHVLSFWETEFPALAQHTKSQNGERVYRPKDIELILEIRKLLYEDGCTITGARKRMEMRAPAASSKKRADRKKSRSSGSAPEPLKESISDPPPIFDPAYDETFDPVYDETEESEADDTADFMEDFRKALEDEKSVIPPAAPAAASGDKRPTSERLKIVRTKLDNILTLLDRE